MTALKAFEFTEEFINRIKATKEIPIHFYNKDGQILIYKKAHCSEDELARLMKFRGRGIFFDELDIEKLAIPLPVEQVVIPEGLTGTKLITEEYAHEFFGHTIELFDDLRQTSLKSIHTKKTCQQMEHFFEDFASQEDLMTGLVNILDVLQTKNSHYVAEMAVKRTVTAMALRVRGLQAKMNYKDKIRSKHNVTSLMMSSMLCDIGCFQMNMPQTSGLSINEMRYVKKHPLLSYLMVAHDNALDPKVKFNILTHHRPRFEDIRDNNYPALGLLSKNLEELAERFKDEPNRDLLINDITNQLNRLKVNIQYNEDANALAIASEFASLTTEVPWRKAFPPERAIKLIINNSFFTYTARIIHEFLDYLAVSLCDNRRIIKEGDYIVVVSDTHDGSKVFEVCQIEHVGRFQSRPGVKRIATVRPSFAVEPKLRVIGFDSKKVHMDKRKAYFELTQDGSRRIAYVVDPVYDGEFYNYLVSQS